MMLDACRDNPFAANMKHTLELKLVDKGFSNIEPSAGFMVVYAAKHGETALDGDGKDSPFATALIKNFNEYPRAYFGDLLNMTAADVRVASRGEQIPEITARGGSPRICLDVTGCVVILVWLSLPRAQ